MKKPFSAIAAGLIAVLIWSAIPAFVKIGSTADGLPFLLVCRFSIACLFFLPVLKIIFQKMKQVKLTLWLALTAILGANYYFQGLAMIDLPVSWYLIIFCLNPILSLIFIGLKFNKKMIFSIMLSILGTLLFVNLDEISQLKSVMPFVYITVGMLTWVAYTVCIQKFQSNYTNVETTALTQLVSLFSCLWIWIFSGAEIIPLNSNEMLSIATLGITTPIAYFGFNACLKAAPRFSIVSQYLEPVFGVLIGLLFFNESLSVAQWIGAGFILIGTVTQES